MVGVPVKKDGCWFGYLIDWGDSISGQSQGPVLLCGHNVFIQGLSQCLSQSLLQASLADLWESQRQFQRVNRWEISHNRWQDAVCKAHGVAVVDPETVKLFTDHKNDCWSLQTNLKSSLLPF
jgi:hypothetical protein